MERTDLKFVVIRNSHILKKNKLFGYDYIAGTKEEALSLNEQCDWGQWLPVTKSPHGKLLAEYSRCEDPAPLLGPDVSSWDSERDALLDLLKYQQYEDFSFQNIEIWSVEPGSFLLVKRSTEEILHEMERRMLIAWLEVIKKENEQPNKTTKNP